VTQIPTISEKRTVHPPAGGFRLAVVVATALVFAAMFGWLACIQRMENGEVEFHWQRRTWLWIAIGIAGPLYFWRQIWPAQNVSQSGAGKRTIKGWAALLIPSLFWVVYPLWFISGPQLLNVGIGLGIAVTALTLGGWMIFRLIQGFAGEETPPRRAGPASRPESESTPAQGRKIISDPPTPEADVD
jgi:hypothetical protein